ncbi:MAG: cobalamin B12-binding domain-containing protein [Geobacteraceae bacterium]|nr:cobalamin B12-binding domain-containing protein [Geobacteraceae bacterium]
MKIIFADLTHSGHNCNAVPYGISLVAANALEKIGCEISVELVINPVEFAEMLLTSEPGIVCFSTFVWNYEISRAFAGRIKARYPNCITIFGGPNYPIDPARQLDFLQENPEIDFFVYREGEASFVGLYQALREVAFDIQRLKSLLISVPGCHYYHDGLLIAGSPLPLIDPLDSLPSPYLTGLCDRFLDAGNSAVMQTVRGCPFSCTYCQDGADYFTPVRRYSDGRIRDELRYIGARAASSTLFLADSNFGMYEQDLVTAQEMAMVQEQHSWPEFVVSISGKNNKELVLKTAATIRGGMFSAAIQSSDPEVLQNIERHNVSVSDLIESASEHDLQQAHSFSEIIVALPGDTFAAHCKSAADLMDAGIHVVRSHQLIMLPGAELSSAESRKKYGLETRFRVIHNTVNPYSLFGETFYAPEVDEICVASNSMSFQNYLKCRCFDLTVETFYNNGVFAELHTLLKQQGICISAFVMEINRCVWDNPVLAELYAGFMADTQELWTSREELNAFLQEPGVLERYKNGELGRNEQLAYKALALFETMETLIDIAYEIAGRQLQLSGVMNSEIGDYLDQLKRFDLLRKQNPMSISEERTGEFHYDFYKLVESGFQISPLECRLNEKIELNLSSTSKHKRFASEMNALMEAGLQGYAVIISKNPKIREYFREVSPSGGNS